MIRVAVEEELGDVWVTTTEHAEGAGEERLVCAAVSHAMMVLGMISGRASWGGDGSGMLAVVVGPEHLQILQATLFGFDVLSQAYPGLIELPANLWHLKTMESVRTWQQLSQPGPTKAR